MIFVVFTTRFIFSKQKLEFLFPSESVSHCHPRINFREKNSPLLNMNLEVHILKDKISNINNLQPEEG